MGEAARDAHTADLDAPPRVRLASTGGTPDWLPQTKEASELPAPREGAQPREIREWLLNLPDPEFEKLIGTRELGRYAGFVCIQIHEDHGGPCKQSIQEETFFLEEINDRSRSLREP
jgi:hypothetical protein